jgi:hypothetical protein
MIELATTLKKQTKAARVREYVAKNPKASTEDIANATGATDKYVYSVMWNAKQARKKAGGMAKKKALTDRAKPMTLKEIKAATKRIQDKFFNAPNWQQVGLFSSDTPADPVNSPAHYNVGGIETIDFIEAKKLNYRLGNVVKYLTRADHKGNKLEDLKKAQWYLEREIESLS